MRRDPAATPRRRTVRMNLSALASVLEGFPVPTAQRGSIYALEERVGAIDVDAGGGEFAATIRGTRRYRCAWSFLKPNWDNTCTCPIGGDCKHAYALGAVLLARAVAGRDDVPASLRPFFPLALVGSPRLPAVRVHDEVAGDESYLDVDADVEADFGQERGRSPLDSDDRGSGAASIEFAAGARQRGTAADPEEAKRQQQARIEEQLRRQLAGWADNFEGRYEKSLRAVLRPHVESRRPGSLLRDRGAVHFELVPLLTSKVLRDAARHQQQIVALSEEAQLRPNLMSPASMNLLSWITRRQLSARSRYLATLDLAALESLLLATADSGLVTWDVSATVNDDVARRSGCRDGQVAALGRGPAEIVPVCAGDNGNRLELRVRLGETIERPFDQVLYLCEDPRGDAGYVIADGLLWRIGAQPPRGVLDGFQALGAIELDTEQHCALLRKLGRHYPGLARTLAEHTALVPSRPTFLVDADATGALHLRLFGAPPQARWNPGGRLAETAPGEATAAGRPAPTSQADTVVFEYLRPGLWQRLADPQRAVVTRSVVEEEEAPWREVAATGDEAGGDTLPLTDSEPSPSPSSSPATVAVDEAWQIEPDPAALASAVAWLTAVATNTVGQGSEQIPPWTLTLRPPNFERFVEAWQSRPRDAIYYATRRVQRMLQDGTGASARIDIKAGGKDWFAIKVEWEVEGKAMSQEEIATLLRSREAFVRLGDTWVNAAGFGEAREAVRVLADAGIDALADEQRITVWQLAAAPPETLGRLEALGASPDSVAAARELRRRVQAFRTLPRAPVPRGFRGKLRGYQRDGLDFLAFTSSLGSGAVLADDMGLGKTVQTLAWLEGLRAARGSDESGDGPALVVCPASVVHNWKDEAARFVPKLKVLALSSGAERQALLEQVGDYDVVISNYALLRRDREHWKQQSLGALVLDEAQNVKNPDAEISRIVRSLTARHRLALTGTPLENRTRDVWSIVECVSPGYLGTRRRFEERFDAPGAAGADSAATELVDIDRRLLGARLRPLMLRRRKSEVATDLPARSEEALYCDLAPEQRRLYLATLRDSRRLVADLDQSGRGAQRARIHILAALTRLRQICCHPGLVDVTLADAPSAKFDVLLELVEPLLEEGHKVLVFSQFARCIGLLARALARRDLRHHVLTGATQQRDKVVAAFQEESDPSLFLVSLKAGGTGLNLTAASYVVLFDPWWNPAVEAQAIDRTHRIGQTRAVMAYRLVASDTIEEKILELQRDKAALADAVVDDATFGRRLAKEDLAQLLAET